MAPNATPIYSVADGKVYRIEIADNGNYGVQVRIAHADGFKTIYAHLDRVLVFDGQQITAGQAIGLADSTGNSSGSHLHLTLKHEDAYEGGDMYKGIHTILSIPHPIFNICYN